MKLKRVRITDFQSVLDSTEFEIGDVTCLVGKNEAGKTALLKALYRLNPITQSDGEFDTAIDFPRRYVTVYEDEVAAARRKPATVVTATFCLEAADIEAVEQIFGPNCLRSKTSSLTLAMGYSNQAVFDGLEVDDEAALKHVIENGKLTKALTDRMQGKPTSEMVEIVLSARKSAAINRVRPLIQEICNKGAAQALFRRVLQGRLPRFLYFDGILPDERPR